MMYASEGFAFTPILCENGLPIRLGRVKRYLFNHAKESKNQRQREGAVRWGGVEWKYCETRSEESPFTAEKGDDAEDTSIKKRKIARQRRSNSHSRLFYCRTTGARRNSWRRQFRL